MITGSTQLAAVMATPIKHSISPLIHNTAFKSLGIDAVYLAFEVGPEELANAFLSIRSFDMLGVNLSMPNKQRAFELVDERSPVAELLGSVNTVVNRQGRLIGHSTDGEGFVASLAEAGVTVLAKHLAVLGSGGAALAIIAQTALDGAKEISVFARNLSDKTDVTEKLAKISEMTNCQIRFLPLEDLAKILAETDILVNATSVGMRPNEAGNLVQDGRWLKSTLVVADIVYEPLETQLLKLARKQGCHTINGLGMLVHQAAAAFELWTGQKMPLAVVKKAIHTKK